MVQIKKEETKQITLNVRYKILNLSIYANLIITQLLFYLMKLYYENFELRYQKEKGKAKNISR